MLTLKDIWNNETVKNMIDENYDVIVLQESQEGCYENKDAFHEYAQKFNDAAKAADSEIVLFMNWPEKKRWDDLELIKQAYQEIASDLNLKVAPVALAWQRSMDTHPEINLFFDDGELPSKYGDYLALCVVYATVTGNSPVGVPYYGFLAEEEATILQQVAWETVIDYQQ